MNLSLKSGRRLALAVSCALASAVTGSALADAPYPVATPDPDSPVYGHPYRHGAVPTQEAHAAMRDWSTRNAGAAGAAPKTLAYRGGVDGIGVTSGRPRVYLVLYGNRWGGMGTDAQGNLVVGNDPVGAVPYLQMLLKGIGTGNEMWSGTVTQYCDGPFVPPGALSCPPGAAHIGYPDGGVLAGVWYDWELPTPNWASPDQLLNEAVRAAQHFGNTTPASNRYAQYVIVSPSGTTPDGFNTHTAGNDFCAWHNFTRSAYGDIAYTNLPYVSDAGGNCGAFNVRDVRDGFSINEGHEYAETVTDQNPQGGWVNPYTGDENADECSWLRQGPGAMGLVRMGNGEYPMQGSWSNDTRECELTHAVVGGGGGGGGTPFADFAGSVRGLTVSYYDRSSDAGGRIGAHIWSFGDGGMSNYANPVHTYGRPGVYVVSETVIDSVDGRRSLRAYQVQVNG